MSLMNEVTSRLDPEGRIGVGQGKDQGGKRRSSRWREQHGKGWRKGSRTLEQVIQYGKAGSAEKQKPRRD